jgi:hypothetical protein
MARKPLELLKKQRTDERTIPMELHIAFGRAQQKVQQSSFKNIVMLQ